MSETSDKFTSHKEKRIKQIRQRIKESKLHFTRKLK